jgi:acyl dehydratase
MTFSPIHLFFDDVEVGQEWTSLGRTITQADIVNFAGLSGDFNPIHMDHHFAKTTPFRGPIAHGLLVFSVGSGLGLHAPPMRTMAILGIKEWYFRDPVFPGDTIHVVSKVLEKTVRARGRRGEVTWQRRFYNQDGRLIMEGVTMTLVEGRASLATSKSAASSGASPESSRAAGEGGA